MKRLAKSTVMSLVALLCVFACAFALGGCVRDIQNNPAATYEVVFDSDGGSPVAKLTGLAGGAKINKPADPEKDGFYFAGWYKEASLMTAWDFGADTVTTDITLYAKWTTETSVIPGESTTERFIALANALPAPDSLAPTKADEDKIKQARAYFNGLSETEKNAENVKTAFAVLTATEEKFAGFKDSVVLLVVIRASTSMCGPVSTSAPGRLPYETGMHGSMLWAAAESAKAAINSLDGRDYVGIISFSQTAALPLGITAANRTDKIDAAINGMATSTGTMYGSAVTIAQTTMDGIADISNRHVLFISGGTTQNDTAAGITAYQAAIKTMAEKGITLSVIDVNPTNTIAQAAAMHWPMAEDGGGTFYPMSCNSFDNIGNLTTLREEISRVRGETNSEAEKITSFAVPNGTVRIEPYQFVRYKNLESITIPAGVTSIGEAAFYGCAKLKNITIPAGLTSIGDSAFRDCIALTDITIPAGVASIGSSSFAGCSGLTNVTIPNSVTSIGSNAFLNCAALTTITIHAGVTSVGSNVFDGCVNLSLTWHYNPGLAANVFGASLTYVVIPDGVTGIGNQAFRGCTGLTSIIVPDSVMSIGEYAFYGCTGLSNFTIGSGVINVGNYAFYDCTNLSVTWRYNPALTASAFRAYLTTDIISDGIARIAANAFSYCGRLTGIEIPAGVTDIGAGAFWGCTGLTGITIPAGVTSIGDSAFRGCTGLTSIIVSEGNSAYKSDGNCLIRISGNALIVGCNTSVIPDYVTSIEDSAFIGCTGLTSITIPGSVASIGNYAFYDCTGLTDVAIEDGVKSIRVIQDCPKQTCIIGSCT